MKDRAFLALLSILLFAGACTSSNNANEQALKDLIVKANEEMFNQGNVDYADQVFTTDYAGGGPDLIKAFVGEMRAAFPDLKVKIDPLIAEGNMTAWRRTHTGTHQGAYLGFSPSGKKISWEDIVISRYEYGKVVEEWSTGNLYEVLQQESKSDNKAEDVLAALQATIDALNQQDAAAYVMHLHPKQSRFLPQSPELFRGVSVEAMEKAFQEGNRFNLEMQDLEVAFYGNTAIVTGYQTGPHNLPDGRTIDGKRPYSIVFIQEGGAWKSVHLHTSTVE